LLPYAALTDWHLTQRRKVLIARYEFRLTLVLTKMSVGHWWMFHIHFDLHVAFTRRTRS